MSNIATIRPCGVRPFAVYRNDGALDISHPALIRRAVAAINGAGDFTTTTPSRKHCQLHGFH
jgi:hypothetical protein